MDLGALSLFLLFVANLTFQTYVRYSKLQRYIKDNGEQPPFESIKGYHTVTEYRMANRIAHGRGERPWFLTAYKWSWIVAACIIIVLVAGSIVK